MLAQQQISLSSVVKKYNKRARNTRRLLK